MNARVPDSKTFFSIETETSRIAAKFAANVAALKRLTSTMPISDEALQKEKNRFIAVKGEATLAEVAGALEVLGGQTWWHVVVRISDRSWGVARFNDLYSSLKEPAEAEKVQLRELSALKPAEAVERTGAETKTAQLKARKSTAGVLIVTEESQVAGILVERVKRSSTPLAAPNLQQLGGKYLDLKAYGSILLSSSRRTRPKPPLSKQS